MVDMRRPFLHLACLCSLVAVAEDGGPIRLVPVEDSMTELVGYWTLAQPITAFLVTVPPGGTLTAALEHPRKAQLQIAKATEEEWNGRRQSPWERLIPLSGKHSFTNKGSDPVRIYFRVKDPKEVSHEGAPYKVLFTRSWTPAPAK